MFYEKDEDYITGINTIHFDLGNIVKNGVASSNRFFTPKEGLERGNMFKEEYHPYKNLTFVPLNPTNEKEALLFRVYEYGFALTDLSLHLNIHPMDEEAYDLFKQYVVEGRRTKEEYERIYGPLSLEDTLYNTYNWFSNPWPWEGEVNSYV